MVIIDQEPGSGRRSPQKRALWLSGVTAMALLLAWLSPMIERHFAPWLIFPMLLGAVLGVASWQLARLLKLSVSRAMMAAVLLAAVILGAGQHVFGWLQYYHQFERQRASHSQAALVELSGGELRAKTLLEFLHFQAQSGRRIGSWRLSTEGTWLSWGADGVILLLSAAGVCYVLQRITGQHRA